MYAPLDDTGSSDGAPALRQHVHDPCNDAHSRWDRIQGQVSHRAGAERGWSTDEVLAQSVDGTIFCCVSCTHVSRAAVSKSAEALDIFRFHKQFQFVCDVEYDVDCRVQLEKRPVAESTRNFRPIRVEADEADLVCSDTIFGRVSTGICNFLPQ